MSANILFGFSRVSIYLRYLSQKKSLGDIFHALKTTSKLG